MEVTRADTHNHEQMRQEPILTKAILPIIKMILTLLCLISEVKLRQLPKSAEPQHSKSARQASNSTAATLNRPLKKLTVNVLHVLQQRDQLVLDGRAGDDARLRQHGAVAARFELHFVHEVLDAVGVEDAVAVDEEHEQVVVAAEIVLVDLVDQFEGFLLAASLAAVREAGDGDSTAAEGNVDADWEGF